MPPKSTKRKFKREFVKSSAGFSINFAHTLIITIISAVLENDSGDELEGAIRRAWMEADNDIKATAMCQPYYDHDKYHLR